MSNFKAQRASQTIGIPQPCQTPALRYGMHDALDWGGECSLRSVSMSDVLFPPPLKKL